MTTTATKGTRLARFDFSQPSNLTSGTKATYPWDEWFDGDIWRIEYHKDFQSHPLMMERVIRTRATQRKAQIRLKHLPLNGYEPFGVIVFQRTDITGPAEAKRNETSAKRKARRDQATKDAAETLAKAGIKPAAKSTAKQTVAKKQIGPAKSAVKKVSKRPAKKPVAA